MKTVNLESSNLKSVTFDDTKKIQDIKIMFNSGSIYTYKSVPITIIENLIHAESVGKFFNSFIKNIYEFKKEG